MPRLPSLGQTPSELSLVDEYVPLDGYIRNRASTHRKDLAMASHSIDVARVREE
jgi:hypothetical protein